MKIDRQNERIRKRLIDIINGALGVKPIESEQKELVAWLEKQGEEARNIALRTEYEKGRTDAIVEMQKEQTQEYLKGADRVQNYKELTKFEKGFDRIADTYARCKNKDGYNKPWYTQERAAEMLYWAKEELGLLDMQNLVDKIEPKFKVGDIIRHKKQGFTCKIIAVDTEYRLFGCNGTHLPFDSQDAYELVEQKPTDKVEPKFKFGEWCIDNEDNTIFQIVKVLDNVYTYKTNEGKVYCCTHYSLENDARLWTIQDAKDGDVLLSSDDSIFIFKEVVDFGCKHYIALATDGTIQVNYNFTHFWESVSGVCPTTKEQRDLLFQKIKEAGFEWDAEKKELIKK